MLVNNVAKQVGGDPALSFVHLFIFVQAGTPTTAREQFTSLTLIHLSF